MVKLNDEIVPRSILERKADRYKELIYLISEEGYVVTEDQDRNLVLKDREDFYKKE